MALNDQQPKPIVDWLTTAAIAAIVVSLNVIFHEGMHALTCIIVGGDLQEFSALHVACDASVSWQGKVVSGFAAIANIILGFILLALLRRSRQQSGERQFFLWLFMLITWLGGSGYWMFSGIANFGDWANVIAGWQPALLWRLMMTLIGAGAYLFFVWFSLKELGKIIGGEADEQIGRAVKLGLIAYFTAVLVAILASLFNPYGMAGAPVVGALMGALFGMSPLLWMMQWFRADSFVKQPRPPLEIRRQWSWVVASVVVVFVYVFILGRTIYF